MAEPLLTVPKLARGSSWGADGVYYPAEEERTVPFSERALRLVVYLHTALRWVFARQPDVYIGGDQFIYWVPGDPSRRIAPDVYVIPGALREPPRDVIRTWEEGVPALVVAISSEGSRDDDRGSKLLGYQNVLRCPEYLVYDADRDDVLFYRLEEGAYHAQPPDEQGRSHSVELGVSFGPDPDVLLRVYDPSGQLVPDYSEVEAENERLRAERDRLRAELARARAEQERLRAQQRRRS